MAAHLVLIDAMNLIRRIYAVQERHFSFNNAVVFFELFGNKPILKVLDL